MEESPRPELFDFHGVPMAHCFTDNWENIQNFQARPDDILIATYPKAGQSLNSQIKGLIKYVCIKVMSGDCLVYSVSLCVCQEPPGPPTFWT